MGRSAKDFAFEKVFADAQAVAAAIDTKLEFVQNQLDALKAGRCLKKAREKHYNETVLARYAHLLNGATPFFHGISQSYKLTFPTTVAAKTFQQMRQKAFNGIFEPFLNELKKSPKWGPSCRLGVNGFKGVLLVRDDEDIWEIVAARDKSKSDVEFIPIHEELAEWGISAEKVSFARLDRIYTALASQDLLDLCPRRMATSAEPVPRKPLLVSAVSARLLDLWAESDEICVAWRYNIMTRHSIFMQMKIAYEEFYRCLRPSLACPPDARGRRRPGAGAGGCSAGALWVELSGPQELWDAFQPGVPTRAGRTCGAASAKDAAARGLGADVGPAVDDADASQQPPCASLAVVDFMAALPPFEVTYFRWATGRRPPVGVVLALRQPPELAATCRSVFRLPRELRQERLAALQESWEAEAARELSSWVPTKDPSSGQHYYYNSQTQESSWQAPKDALLPAHYMRMKATELARFQDLGSPQSTACSEGPTPPAPRPCDADAHRRVSASTLDAQRSVLRSEMPPTAGFPLVARISEVIAPAGFMQPT
ncbi:unnamed protein product [Prorocentrum cordatum]|uniref:WW domain-containing protein n=1 Tax=Prorocentrum cordatum TaxID=2364126 RepID=A0ABN9QFF7_9DINO|nr:unnamed protein product [Polarella glacialis]